MHYDVLQNRTVVLVQLSCQTQKWMKLNGMHIGSVLFDDDDYVVFFIVFIIIVFLSKDKIYVSTSRQTNVAFVDI